MDACLQDYALGLGSSLPREALLPARPCLSSAPTPSRHLNGSIFSSLSPLSLLLLHLLTELPWAFQSPHTLSHWASSLTGHLV